jgi:hypothetical protein
LRLSRVIVRKYRGIKDTGPLEDRTAAWVNWSGLATLLSSFPRTIEGPLSRLLA